MGVKIEYKKAGRIELEYGDCSKCTCIVLAESDADITALARGWLYESLTAKQVTAYVGLTDKPIVCYVSDNTRCIRIIN